MELGQTGRFVQPEIVASHFHLREGDKIADFGAGSGFFLKALSAAVGSEGRVYACEIQKVLVDRLAQVAREQHLGNVEPLWCDLEAHGGTKLSDGLLDAGVLINTLFLIEDKATALHEMARTLRKGAKFFIIDWTESFGGLGPHPSQVVPEVAAKGSAEGAGLVFERDFSAGDHHYGLAFRKP